MTDDKRTKGNELKEKIERAEGELVFAKDAIGYTGYNFTGSRKSMTLSKEVKEVIQTIVVAHLAKNLADLAAEYEAL